MTDILEIQGDASDIKFRASLRMVPVVLEPFPDGVQSDIAESLSIPALTQHLHAELQLIADAYRTQVASGKTIRRERRAHMEAMAEGLRSALDAHEAIECGDLLDIVMVSPGTTFDDLLILAEQLRKWTPVFEELAQRPLPRGRENNDRLVHCCERLRMFYEDVTGQEATHTSLLDMAETGMPQSPFGKFVVAFFRHVDPDMIPHLNEALRKALWPSRKGRATRV